ncbi:DoxX family protein [Sedimentitalea nanhaiensis]|uniref:Putative oxidoreductase n=1 Tax=Sedimentitalea nanhaiensis TaxID=999627 RepID=A0A1I7CPG2_9RHOB|nr:DoxX family protein [Sedimentitalea nanhaiensis]SFU01294.1 putative oxidoreductase [Sedimentitalea nanhaiensis]
MTERHKELDYLPDNIEIIATTDAPMAHWLLRAALSATFLFHGLGKLGDPAATAQNFGLSPEILTVAAMVELTAPVALCLGGLMTSQLGDLMTRLGGLCAIAVLIGAISVAHWGQWSFAPTATHPLGGMEFQVTLIAIGMYFVFRGNSV